MKFTGMSLIVIGAMLLLLGCVQFTQTGLRGGEPAGLFSLNPFVAFLVGAGSMTAGGLIIRYGGKGYSWRSADPPPAVGPPAD